MPWLAGVAPVVGGVIGNLASQGDRNNANQQEQQAVQQWLSINVPDPAQQRIELQRYVQTGSLSPQLEQAIKQGPSAMQNITTDPGLKSAQMNALGQLQNEGMQGGLTLQDQATLQQQENNTAAQARGRNGAIQNQYAAQGLGGSGMQLQAQLANAQNATQNQGMNSLQAAADARSRALQAVQGAGSMAGQMQNQQYNQQANLAQAQDAINQFNTRNSQNVQNTNTQNANQAQQYNLGLQQSVADRNTGLANQQEMYNKGLLQQNFNNQLAKAGGASGAQNDYAKYLGGQANATAGMWAGIGSGVGKGVASAYGGSKKQDDEEEE